MSRSDGRTLPRWQRTPGWALSTTLNRGFKVGKAPSPNYLTSRGLNATIASYFAATGLSSDLTLKNVADPKTREFVKQLESSVVHYGDTTLTSWRTWPTRAAAAGVTYVSAVTVEEKSVWTATRATHRSLPGLGQSAARRSRWSRSIPTTARWFRQPVDDPRCPVVDGTGQQASADFLAWLQGGPPSSRPSPMPGSAFEGPRVRSSRENRMLLPAAPRTFSLPTLADRVGGHRPVGPNCASGHVLVVMDGDLRLHVRAGTRCQFGQTDAGEAGGDDGS